MRGIDDFGWWFGGSKGMLILEWDGNMCQVWEKVQFECGAGPTGKRSREWGGNVREKGYIHDSPIEVLLGRV